MKFYRIFRPSMEGTTIPVYYYTFANDKDDAIHKVQMKWGEYDNKTIARVVDENELDELVIATNYFG